MFLYTNGTISKTQAGNILLKEHHSLIMLVLVNTFPMESKCWGFSFQIFFSSFIPLINAWIHWQFYFATPLSMGHVPTPSDTVHCVGMRSFGWDHTIWMCWGLGHIPMQLPSLPKKQWCHQQTQAAIGGLIGGVALALHLDHVASPVKR